MMWAYKVIESSTPLDEDALYELGQWGWELVSTDLHPTWNMFFYFKRAI